MQIAIPLSRPRSALWLLVFFYPSVLLLSLNFCQTILHIYPSGIVTLALFSPAPLKALVVCGILVRKSENAASVKLNWMLYTEIAMLIQTLGLLFIMPSFVFARAH